MKAVPGTTSVYAERTATGRYVDIDIDRVAAGRYGLNIKDVQDIVGSAVGGMTVSYTVEGLERYPINLRYPQDFRDSLEKLRQLPIVAPTGANVTLQDVARVEIADGPGMIRSENARPSGWVFVDMQGRDLGGFVNDAKARIADELTLPAGYSLSWSGQYEYLQRAVERLQLVVPLTLGIIVLLLYLNFRNARDVGLILFTLAVRARRRYLAAVLPRLRPLDRGRGGFHRPGGCRGGDRRGDGHVPGTLVGRTPRTRGRREP